MSINVPDSLFRGSPEFVASYPFNDIAQNTGIVNFYAGSTNIGAARVNFLVENTIQGGTAENFGYTKTTGTYSFDTVPFKLPRTLLGTAYATVRQWGYNTSSGTDGESTVTDIKLTQVHVGGGTSDITNEADLLKVIHTPTTGLTQDSRVVVWNENTTPIIIKKGEKIRLTLTMTEAGSNGSGGFCHNPAGTDSDALASGGEGVITNTQLVVSIPFRLNLP